MKSQFAEFRNADEALESALRDSAPRSEFPPELHDSIMNAVHTAHRAESTQVSDIGMLQRFTKSWFRHRIAGLSCLVYCSRFTIIRWPHPNLSLWLNVQAFATTREFVDSLPSVAVGPLSDELDKVNRDLDRTAEFLIATLP